MSVILSTGSTSKANKKRVTFFITFTNVLFIFRIKNAFFNVFYYFPNVYYNYAENPCLVPGMEWIGCGVCEIFAFKLYCDLETGVRGHSGH